VMVEAWHTRAGAILQTFYAGMEGGTALARLLFGEVSPSGHLPFTVARDAAHYPFFDRTAQNIEYGYWHGYAKFAHEGLEPRYAFGHGLSYTSFARAIASVECDGDTLSVAVVVTNTGDVAGTDIVQCYIGHPGTVTPRAAFELKGFARATLEPGETQRVTITVPIAALRYRDAELHRWVLELGTYCAIIADAANDPASLRAEFSPPSA
jgi:beta-glucosidase